MSDMEKGFEAVARNLREFGCPDVTGDMISEIHTALKEGKREGYLPHGVVGMFAQSQILERPDVFGIEDDD